MEKKVYLRWSKTLFWCCYALTGGPHFSNLRHVCGDSLTLYGVLEFPGWKWKFRLLLGVTVHEFMLISICQCLCHNEPLTPRNLWNHETMDTTKTMKPWNHWHHETYETMKLLTPRNLWNHETIDTMRPLKPWLHGTIIIWHRHLHMLISINSCTVTPSCNRTLLLLRL